MRCAFRFYPLSRTFATYCSPSDFSFRWCSSPPHWPRRSFCPRATMCCIGVAKRTTLPVCWLAISCWRSPKYRATQSPVRHAPQSVRERDLDVYVDIFCIQYNKMHELWFNAEWVSICVCLRGFMIVSTTPHQAGLFTCWVCHIYKIGFFFCVLCLMMTTIIYGVCICTSHLTPLVMIYW